MATVSLQKAQAELGELLIRAEAGEEIVIERGDLPAVRLIVTERTDEVVRRAGALAHRLRDLPDDLFLTPMDEDELQAWEGKYSNDFDK
ncbi:type II toxin-antitoxin system Phd/YefM family antitoxin [Aureimonas leprariae]|uniref:Prevent-host-death protein n=1 Tax=Plantimonas leprariae TaxID=2615207 RepID=A0A7V7PL29_9HYPH|nr:prevent-host-death protein [Aureimonas leprariae]KAB0676689.1 prevent-host-death protein [Aureimonas leprariae]